MSFSFWSEEEAMSQITSPCAVDTLLESLSGAERDTLRSYVEMFGVRFAFVTREEASGGLEATLLSLRQLVPVRQVGGGRWDVRVVPLALVLTMGLREEPDGVEVQLELFQGAPLVLRWPGETLASVADDKAFRLLVETCGFAASSPERAGRLGFRGLG
jgi:hypothetical protein